MQKTAVFWIRDGVLIDRMPVNAVAFAVASLTFAHPNQLCHTNLTQLVNFAFATSGISCADKMRKLNSEQLPLIADVTTAADYYTKLANAAGSQCHYFEGVCNLVKQLQESCVLNFITSAVEQTVLDTWSLSAQAKPLVPYVKEILGKREGFDKGRDHFAYVQRQYGVERILYVADAIAEISTGAQLAKEFNILPVGFAHLITSEKIRQAYDLIMGELKTLPKHTNQCSAIDLSLNESELALPDQKALQKALSDANANYVASGSASQIITNLVAYFNTSGIFSKDEASHV